MSHIIIVSGHFPLFSPFLKLLSSLPFCRSLSCPTPIFRAISELQNFWGLDAGKCFRGRFAVSPYHIIGTSIVVDVTPSAFNESFLWTFSFSYNILMCRFVKSSSAHFYKYFRVYELMQGALSTCSLCVAFYCGSFFYFYIELDRVPLCFIACLFNFFIWAYTFNDSALHSSGLKLLCLVPYCHIWGYDASQVFVSYVSFCFSGYVLWLGLSHWDVFDTIYPIWLTSHIFRSTCWYCPVFLWRWPMLAAMIAVDCSIIQNFIFFIGYCSQPSVNDPERPAFRYNSLL